MRPQEVGGYGIPPGWGPEQEAGPETGEGKGGGTGKGVPADSWPGGPDPEGDSLTMGTEEGWPEDSGGSGFASGLKELVEAIY